MREAVSVVAQEGKRVFEYAGEESVLILLRWQRTLPYPTLIDTELLAFKTD